MDQQNEAALAADVATLDAFEAFATRLEWAAQFYTWEVTRSGYLRGVQDGTRFCPVTAVYAAESGEPWPIGQAFGAADFVFDGFEHLNYVGDKPVERAATATVQAADHDNRRDALTEAIRQRLIAVVGLA